MTTQSLILNDSQFIPESRSRGLRRVLLINPPVYDAQYWARWSQPAGLLRIGSWLKERRNEVRLIDCMETDARGIVPKTRRKTNGEPVTIKRGDIERPVYHFGKRWEEVKREMLHFDAPPEEIWITSVMTYWWESTKDAVTLARETFPEAQVFVGGIYPTLAPEHAQEHLGADVIFTGELREASDCWTDLGLYARPPTYAILTTTRGCPWDCHYCGARALNGGSNKVRGREPEDVLDEIKHKMDNYQVRHFGFYEDNALVLRGHLQRVLELIIERKHKVELYAPEGFETRMLNEEILRLMKKAGFQKIYLPFEALKWDTNLGWNRRHASTASFDQAFQAAINAGFKPRTQQINAFVLFGLPDEKLEDIIDSVLYVHHTVGSVIPMLFTPVPGTHIYRQFASYLHSEMNWDLQHLNGKLLPFLEHNARRYPDLQASDYLQLEALMSVLNNGKFLSRAANLCDGTAGSAGFRTALAALRPTQP